MSGLSGVVMPNRLCASVEGQFEKFTAELILESFSGATRDLAPHVGDYHDIFECRVTTKFTEHPEIPSGGSGNLKVVDPMDVDDPRKRGPFPISVEGFRPEDQGTNADVHSRGGQESYNRLRNIRIAL